MQVERTSQKQPAEAGRQINPAASIKPRVPAPAPLHPILQLQQTKGNQAVQRLLRSRAIQAKLAISQPGDIYEQEADRVADHVMRMPDPGIQRACSACTAGGSTCAECETEGQALLQPKTERPFVTVGSVPDDFMRNLGRGEPLDAATRAYFEPRFGHDFSNVRVHSSAAAQQSAHEVSANAYTVGNDIVFAAGRYAPTTGEGRRLIAHELTHVVQQSTSDAVRPGQDSEQTPVRNFHPTAAAGPHIARQAAPAYGKACSRDPNKVDPCQLARCSPGQQTTATADFATGLRYVNASVTALAAAPLSGFTSRAMDWYFGGHDTKTISSVSARLGCIATSLTSAPSRYGCHPDYDALGYTCASGAALCGHLARNICFTDAHFGSNPRTRAITAIHEAAHLEGMSTGSASTNPDIYEHQNRFLDISPAQAVQNADSYALFAAAIGTNDLPSTVLLTVAAGGGWALSPYADRTWYFQGTLGLEFQHPRLRVFNPTIGLGFTVIGEAENPNSGIRASTSMLGSLLFGLRIGEARRPGAGGGPELSLFGGPALSLSEDTPKLGAVAGVAFGYRWRLLEVSVGAGYAYDPARSEAGLQHTATVGGTFTMNFNLK
jgi:hypothetical protein